MKFVIIFLAILVAASCQSSNLNTGTAVGSENNDYIRSLISRIVDHFAWKVQVFGELFNFKFRLVNFLASLWTPDNLNLLRTALGYTARAATWAASFVPSEDSSPYDGIVSFILRNTGLYPTTEQPQPEGEYPEPSEIQQDQYVAEASAPVGTQVPLYPGNLNTNGNNAKVAEVTSKLLENYRHQDNLNKLINSK